VLDDLKQQVCQANLDLVAHGLVTLTWGNVSGLSADGAHFVIKPSGVAYDAMRPEHMVVVSVESGAVVDGKLKPSSDTPTHRVLYQRFAGIGGITHTHSTRATVFAQARREIPCFGTTHADHFYGPVPVTRPLTAAEITEAYELNTGLVIVERFAALDPLAVPGVLVASHAPFAWGKNAADSVKNAVTLEAVADMALGTLALEPGMGPVESYLLDKHYFRKHGKDAYYGQSENKNA
jgi:L-ribulose-5-phosphate 4-epimerase